MKKTTLLIALIVTVWTNASAQKNSLLLYGNLDIENHETLPNTGASTKTSSYAFSPGFGYQLSDNWTAGINMYTKNSKYGSTQEKSKAFSVGPFVRYAVPLSEIFAVYGQLDVNSLYEKYAGIKSTGVNAIFFPAIGVNLKNGFALNFNFGSLAYKTVQVKGDGEKNHQFGLSFGSGVGFGISKNFSL